MPIILCFNRGVHDNVALDSLRLTRKFLNPILNIYIAVDRRRKIIYLAEHLNIIFRCASVGTPYLIKRGLEKKSPASSM